LFSPETSPITERERRGEILILYDILKQLPGLKSHIKYGATLSLEQERHYFSYMLRRDLMILRGRHYVMTEKGIRIKRRIFNLLRDLGDLDST
jgi:predicted transcriptional regulator